MNAIVNPRPGERNLFRIHQRPAGGVGSWFLTVFGISRAGNAVAEKSAGIRPEIKNMRDPAEPFKIMGNGEVYLLTSPQGHILFGAGSPDTIDQVSPVEVMEPRSEDEFPGG